MRGTDRNATDGSQLTAYSLRPSDSEPSAVSRKPMAAPDGQVHEQFLGKVIRLTAGHQAKVEEKPQVRRDVFYVVPEAASGCLQLAELSVE